MLLILFINDTFGLLKLMARIYFNDEYDPLKFIPPDYEQFIVLEDSTVGWNSIPELQELADKIIQWKKLLVPKDSKEYNLFCYRTAQMLHEHEYRKKLSEAIRLVIAIKTAIFLSRTKVRKKLKVLY